VLSGIQLWQSRFSRDARALRWSPAPIAMLQRTRRRLARIVLSLMLCHAAALTGSSLVQAQAASAEGCQCCCKGGAQMLTCPMMAHGRSSTGCRLRCGAKPQPEFAVGFLGVPLPTVVHSVSLTSEELSRSVRYEPLERLLPVPDRPPRPTVSPR
jgi:hypothetical protein